MGSQQSVQALSSTLPEKSVDLRSFTECLVPYTIKGPTGLPQLTAAWAQANPNNNQILSLSEMEAWLKQLFLSRLGLDDGQRIWEKYRKSYIRAFADAKDIAPDTVIDEVRGDDFVTKKEFRLCNVYLCVYAAMWECFNAIDGAGPNDDNDKRVNIEEWTAAYPRIVGEENEFQFAAFEKLREDPKANSAEDVFKEIDGNGKGLILFSEWCDYLKRAEIEAETEIGKMLAVGDDDLEMIGDLKI